MFAKPTQPKLRQAKSPVSACFKAAREVAVCTVVASLVCALPVNAGLGYLPTIGPSALRYAAPVVAYDRSTLPALDMGDVPVTSAKTDDQVASVPQLTPPAATATSATPPATVPPATSASVSPEPTPANNSTNVVAAPFTGPIVAPEAREGVMSPQMLLHFFRPNAAGGTNGATTVVVPPSFTPPPPPPARSSTATFDKN